MTLRCQQKGREPSSGRKPVGIALTISVLRRESFERGLETRKVREGKEQRYPIIQLNRNDTLFSGSSILLVHVLRSVYTRKLVLEVQWSTM